MGKITLDDGWVTRRIPLKWQIGLATFGILALELAVIRWVSGQVRIFAYFNNLVLIGAFLGMGLGVALGRRFPGIHHLTLPALAVLSGVLAFAKPLGLSDIRFPDPSIHLWGNFIREGGALVFSKNLLLLLLVFCAICAVFLLAGGALGHLFTKLPALKAYGADLLGSLLGVAAIAVVTSLSTSPPWWFALGSLPLLLLSRRWFAAVSFVAIVVFTQLSVGGALFSPYNRIDIARTEGGLELSVNRHFHQYMHDLSDAHLSDPEVPERLRKSFWRLRRVYDVPFTINDAKGSALIVGAGTGNDVQAALRSGYKRVVSVDIDGLIIALGQKLHPERPYADKRVVPVVDDARAFFKKHRGPPFDVVCFGLLDSHSMFSSLSSLRLDNYVYTEEGIRSAWQLVSDRGHLSLSFSTYAGAWISDRIYWTIYKATGLQPIVLRTGMHHSYTYVVAKPGAKLHGRGARGFKLLGPRAPLEKVMTTSDDWPFLYIRPGNVPYGYIAVLAAILLLTFFSVRKVFYRSGEAEGGARRSFDPALFCIGAAFLLLETRGVTTFSLLFGSTWVVNAAIFAGVLIMVFCSNAVVDRFKLDRPTPWFVALFGCTLILAVINPAILSGFPVVVRGLLGGLLNGLPIGVAGVIFSMLLARSADPAAALGSNLLGAVVGGITEYFSMVVGLQGLVYLALCLYLAAFLFHLRRKQSTATS